jgi:ribosomal protein S18 acetylase RimI-like enzyme
MPAAIARQPAPAVHVRVAQRGDLDGLVELENLVFATDRLSRRSLRRFLASRSAAVIVAEENSGLAGTAIVLFRPRSQRARLYSIAVAPHMAGRGVAALLLAVADAAALARHCTAIRLEVHAENSAAIARYRKSGYVQFDHQAAYYEDGGDALRFEKQLGPHPRRRASQS